MRQQIRSRYPQWILQLVKGLFFFLVICRADVQYYPTFFAVTNFASSASQGIKNSATIYPQPTTNSDKDFSRMPILIFLVGTALKSSAYESIFATFAERNSVIVYVLDTNPGSISKDFAGFQRSSSNIILDIQSFFDVEMLSSDIYLGGHSVGGLIALNAFFPANDKAPPQSTVIINPVIPFQVKGFICFDAVDGSRATSAVYAEATKYFPNKHNRYVTDRGLVNPYPILMFATNLSNTFVDPMYGGQRAMKVLAGLDNNPDNKYLFVSEGKYHHLDYIDPNAKIGPFPAYRTDFSRGWGIQQQIEFVTDFQQFIQAKIASFMFSSRFDTAGFEDVHLVSN